MERLDEWAWHARVFYTQNPEVCMMAVGMGLGLMLLAVLALFPGSASTPLELPIPLAPRKKAGTEAAASTRPPSTAVDTAGVATTAAATAESSTAAGATASAASAADAAADADADDDSGEEKDDPFYLSDGQRDRLKNLLKITDDEIDIAVAHARRGEQVPSIASRARWLDAMFYVAALSALGYFAYQDYGINVFESIRNLFPREADVLLGMLQRLNG